MTIKDIDPKQCTGCSLCMQLCSMKCISMLPNKEGFLFPNVDENLCIKCGVCYAKCPARPLSITLSTEQPFYYASSISDKEDLMQSSSGGIFIALARYFISSGGYVCGCVFNEQMQAIHICTNKLDNVKKMQGSKYVQSSIENVLPQIRHLLNNGNKVLFTGTACQIAAVKAYVKTSDKLFLVDILCHGVPSPLFFKKYIDYLEDKHHGKIVNIEFRNKKKLGWGSEHRTYYEVIRKGNLRGYRPIFPAYFCAFFWGLNLRESCYNCVFAGEKRISDITIGDFWGYWAYYHKNFPEGISIVSVNTSKGRILFEEIKKLMLFCDKVPSNMAKGTNTNFYHPTVRPSSRNYFYDNLKIKQYKDYIWDIYLNKDSKRKVLVSLYGRFVPRCIKNILNCIK